jgi:hypothetical protein
LDCHLKDVTKERRTDFELQIVRASVKSTVWGNLNDLSAQFEFLWIGVETKFVPFFFLEVST